MTRHRRRGRTPAEIMAARNPFTPDEDEKLREVNQIGLASEFWHLALPRRTFGEMVERRYALGIKPCRLI